MKLPGRWKGRHTQLNLMLAQGAPGATTTSKQERRLMIIMIAIMYGTFGKRWAPLFAVYALP
ncbi:hypothetical protein B0H13DRAFT_2395194 [Mycena leptocephala]|nr:hypothetical protein B0H13DRAFT_2395194 [Mycena leptocephala]